MLGCIIYRQKGLESDILFISVILAKVNVGRDPYARSEDDGPRWALQTFQQKSTVVGIQDVIKNIFGYTG